MYKRFDLDSFQELMRCRYEKQKDELLKEKRNVSFEDVIQAIENNAIYIVPNPKP